MNRGEIGEGRRRKDIMDQSRYPLGSRKGKGESKETVR